RQLVTDAFQRAGKPSVLVVRSSDILLADGETTQKTSRRFNPGAEHLDRDAAASGETKAPESEQQHRPCGWFGNACSQRGDGNIIELDTCVEGPPGVDEIQ